MTEQTLRDLYRQTASARQASAPLAADADDTLAAVLLGGTDAQREIGREQLASLPAGPAVARVLQAMAPDARQLETGIARRRGAARRPWPALVALAAGFGAAAVLVVGVRDTPVAPVQPAGQQILVASFEAEPPTQAEAAGGRIFTGGFGS